MSAAIRAGRAFVELFLKDVDFNKALDNAKMKLNAWKAALQQIGVAALGIGTAMVTPFALATKAAGDLYETTSKLKILFNEAPEAAIAWVDGFSGAVGRSKKESADALSAFQAMFVGMGMTQQAAGELAKEFTSLAIDFGSFHNVSDPEAIERFISAFAGSSQVLDMFGINIKQSALDLKLLEMGFETCMGGATELQKILARAEIIRETMGTQGAIGDAIRTADSFSNTFKRLRGEVMNFAAEVGAMVMPIFQQLMSWFSVGLAAVKKWLDDHKEVAPFLLKAALAIGTFGAAMLALAGVVTVLAAITAALKKLQAAYIFFTANPIGLVLGSVALIASLAVAFNALGASIGEVSREMQEMSEKNARQRSDDELRMKRLQQLADKQSLSNDETKEAAALIDSLQARYGNLGISIDSVTGKIEGMTDAQKKLTAAMKAMEIADLKKEINETEKNYAAKRKEAFGGLTTNEALFNEKSGQKRVQQAEKEMDLEHERLKALQARLKALNGDANPDLSAAEIEKRAEAERKRQAEEKKAKEKKAEDGKEAAKDLAKIEDDRRREGLSKLERDIEDAQRRGDERRRLNTAVAQGNPDDMMGGFHDWMMKDEQIKAETEADIAAIRQKAADEEAKKAEEARRGQLDDIARKELELKYAAKVGETEEQAAKREHEKRLAMIDLEQKQALANAKEGLDPALIAKDFDVQRQLANAEFGAKGVAKAEKKIETMGSFSAAAIGRYAAGRIEEQQLAELKKQSDLLAKIEKKEGGIPVVGDNE